MSTPYSPFQVSVPGKWVLAGEHSVLRGATAVALPHPEYALNFKFEPGASSFSVDPKSAAGIFLELLEAVGEFWRDEEKIFEMPRGKIQLQSTIPIGAGLGSSAALCVAMTVWLSEPLSIPENERFEFATRLEHRFHGRSSGMDVAVISAKEPISFSTEKGARALGVKKIPKFTFHDTGLRTRTSECVVRVEKYRETYPHEAIRIDEAMAVASRQAVEGLFLYDQGKTQEGLEQIAKAMKQAQECFYCWELVPGQAKRLQDELAKKGALATKLTGAGGGGMVVALWE